MAASGETEFGYFISTGTIEKRTRESPGDGSEYIMTLARRYLISERDVRFKTHLRDRVQEQIAMSVSRPWEHIPLKPKRDKSNSMKNDDTIASGKAKKRKREVVDSSS